jgi:hypothetical protein
MEAEHMNSNRRGFAAFCGHLHLCYNRAPELNFGTGLGHYLVTKYKPVHGADCFMKTQMSIAGKQISPSYGIERPLTG